MAQFFVGKDTLVCDAYGIKSQKQFIYTLYDNIKTGGAMDTIITDGGKYEISTKLAEVLRSLFIKQYESEPYHQHQTKLNSAMVLSRGTSILDEPYRAPSPLLDTLHGLCLCTPECYSITCS